MPIDIPAIRLVGIAPELVLSAAALIILIADAFFPVMRRWAVPLLSTLALVVAGFFAVDAWGVDALHLGRMVAVDGFAAFVKVSLVAFGLLTVWIGREYLKREELEEPEFYALVLFAVAGMMLMASAADLIVIFLALETFSIALYVLVGLRRRGLASQESAMKYFLLGSISSAFFLLGIALVYGAVGSTNLYGDESTGVPGILQYLNSTPTGDEGLLVFGTGLLIVGLGFKIAAVPFHMWTPDAYQGAPAPVTGFMAAGSKFAGFAALLRVLDAALFPLEWDWRPLVIGIAVLTMVLGSVFAVVQEDVKRMLAYSSIAHAGFVLIGVIAVNDVGVAASLFYLATYGVTVLGGFAVVAVLAGRNEGRTRLVDLKGAFDQHPALVGALTLFMLSLAGVPLTSGFVGKLVVFGAAIDAGYTWLVVVGALASVIAAFFYLRMLVVMYMQEADELHEPTRAGPLATLVIGIAAAATIVLGLAWGPLIDIAEKATFVFTG